MLHLSANEHKHLNVIIQTTLEIEEQRRALDACGLRFLISMRSFYILNAAAAATSDIDVGKGSARHRLRYRDMVWAFHSESQELLVSAAKDACGGKMLWSDAKAIGMFLWLGSTQQVVGSLSPFRCAQSTHYTLRETNWKRSREIST
jgi:hypothetical protein